MLHHRVPKLTRVPDLLSRPPVCAANRRWNAQHFNLLAQQQQGEAPVYVPVWRIWLKPKLLHIKEGWWRLRWQLQQQQMPDTLSRVRVEELPAFKRVVVGIHQYSSTWTDGDHTGNLLEQQQARQQVRTWQSCCLPA